MVACGKGPLPAQKLDNLLLFLDRYRNYDLVATEYAQYFSDR
jgi:hypothetical protein